MKKYYCDICGKETPISELTEWFYLLGKSYDICKNCKKEILNDFKQIEKIKTKILTETIKRLKRGIKK